MKLSELLNEGNTLWKFKSGFLGDELQVTIGSLIYRVMESDDGGSYTLRIDDTAKKESDFPIKNVDAKTLIKLLKTKFKTKISLRELNKIEFDEDEDEDED